MKQYQPPTAAALYARVSSERQDVDLSVAGQLRALRDYAKTQTRLSSDPTSSHREPSVFKLLLLGGPFRITGSSKPWWLETALFTAPAGNSPMS